jgi:hypothetical protein
MVLVTPVTMREMSYLQKNAIIFQACADFQCNSSVEGASQMNWSGESGDCWSMENDEANDVLTSFTVTTKCFMKNVMYCDNKMLHEERQILWRQQSASWRTSYTVTTKCFMKNVFYCDITVLHGEHHMLWQRTSWRTMCEGTGLLPSSFSFWYSLPFSRALNDCVAILSAYYAISSRRQ